MEKNKAARAAKRTHIQVPAMEGVPPYKRRADNDSVWDWVKAFAIAIVLAVAVRMFVMEFQQVDGPSMLPTLQKNETIFVNKLAYAINPPRRGDIIICHYPGRQETFVKRIVALPGETVEIRGGVVYINGEAGKDVYSDIVKLLDMEPVIVPGDAVFVMGDNRNDSLDSSSPVVGPIHLDQVRGRVQAIVWPFEKIKNLYAPWR